MRVKRSEAVHTRMETRRQRTLLATLMNNVATSTNGGRAVLTVQRNEERAKREAVLEKEDALQALRDKLDEKPDYMVRNVERDDQGRSLSLLAAADDALSRSNAITYRADSSLHVQQPPTISDAAARIANLENEVQQLQNQVSVERNFRMYLHNEVQELKNRIATLEQRP